MKRTAYLVCARPNGDERYPRGPAIPLPNPRTVRPQSSTVHAALNEHDPRPRCCARLRE